MRSWNCTSDQLELKNSLTLPSPALVSTMMLLLNRHLTHYKWYFVSFTTHAGAWFVCDKCNWLRGCVRKKKKADRWWVLRFLLCAPLIVSGRCLNQAKSHLQSTRYQSFILIKMRFPVTVNIGAAATAKIIFPSSKYVEKISGSTCWSKQATRSLEILEFTSFRNGCDWKALKIIFNR